MAGPPMKGYIAVPPIQAAPPIEVAALPIGYISTPGIGLNDSISQESLFLMMIM
jgi:hypothetical protein